VRILVANNYPLSIAEQLVREDRYPAQHLWGIDALRAAGHQVILAPDDAHPWLSRRGSSIGDVGRSLSALQHRSDIDLLYGADAATLRPWALARRSRLTRKPVVLTQHQPPGRHPAVLQGLRGADAVICLSRVVQGQVEDLRQRPATWLPWGPDLAFAGYSGPVSDVGGVVSTGKTQRDVQTLLQAMGRAGVAGSVFAPGGTPSPERVKVVSTDVHRPYLDVLQHVRVAAVVAIPLADPTKLTGLTELADAMALGKPVVMTRSPLVDVDLEDLGCGITVEAGDVLGWERALSELVQDAERRERMGRKARAAAVQHFNTEAYGAGVVRLLEETLRIRSSS
jgi:glycosyltransferase involved in cell wall biosynthesis